MMNLADFVLFCFLLGDGISRESSPFINSAEMDRGNMYEGKNMALFEVSSYLVVYVSVYMFCFVIYVLLYIHIVYICIIYIRCIQPPILLSSFCAPPFFLPKMLAQKT